MDIKKSILKWYNNHSNFLDATLDIASDLVPGGKMIINLLKASKAVYDDEGNIYNKQISQDQIHEITHFLHNIQPLILNLMEEVEHLKEFKNSCSGIERKKILIEGPFKNELQKVIPKIASSLTETVNRTKSSINLINNIYLKLETLGHGGEGTVYKCINTLNDLVVAVKILPHQLGSNGYELLKKEYHRLIKNLLHPNIVQYRDLSIDKNSQQCYIVMDFLEGETLRSLMIKKKLSENKVFSLDETILLLTGISKALAHSHKKDILHLDLKPENILVDHNKESYLFDFGLSQDLKHTLLSSQNNQNTTCKGTLAYMAPEQYKSKKTGVQTDIWAFGVIIYEMLSGIHPFNGKTFEHFYKLVCEEEVEDIEKLSNNINSILKLTLQKKRKDRLSSTTEILKRLEDKQENQISIELPEIQGCFYKIIRNEKTQISSGRIILNTNENLGVKLKNNEDLKKVLNLSDINLEKIKYFDVSYTNISDEEIKTLSNLNNLQDLELSGSIISNMQINDKSLNFISNLKNLHSLYLRSCNQISDNGLGFISNLNNLQKLGLTNCNQISDKGLEFISNLKDLQSLCLWGCKQISDNGLGFISNLKDLQSLCLWECHKISDNGLEFISNLNNLQNLDLTNCNQISDKGLGVISNLNNLQSLCLWGCYQISDKGLNFISNLNNLQDLNLRRCYQISGKGLNFISNLNNLQDLNLSFCNQISDKDLEFISNLKSLQSLCLWRCTQISDKGLNFISKLHNLQSLNLANCDLISDKGLEFISKLHNLQDLNLYRCDQISDKAVKKLQEQLKYLRIRT